MDFDDYGDDGGYDDTYAWDDYNEFGNDRGFRNRQYANAYGDYRGGYRGRGPRFGPLPPPPPPPMCPPPMYRGPPGPSAIFGRGFGPDGPPMMRPNRIADNRAVKFLIRCGVPKENLKGLPRSLLELIEPHYCGLCGHTFDSFSTSRLHYLSKNHEKNKKKWLGQSGLARAQLNETPMRARELYCELCDVQITSKAHADSHYAGRSHKAIVIGNKGPKNPALLQRGMEKRVQQLIRREKKFLDSKAEAKEEKPKDEPAATNPDLYCDICKTSVTCSEQMTMHLNGKRHLQKEKQHILKTMRGDDGHARDEGEGEWEGEEGEGDAEGETGEGAAGAEAEPAPAAEGQGNGAAGEGATTDEWEQAWE